mmetsp:Transcript_17373/g.27237  ORF Transcript_17373/g.27237 Transcript_17373/m.27237 type:complete len:111 (-) Transcript_17373:959-1291(-)
MDTVVHHAILLEEVMSTKCAVLRPLPRAAAPTALMMQHLRWRIMQKHVRQAALNPTAIRMIGGEVTIIVSSHAILPGMVTKVLSVVLDSIPSSLEFARTCAAELEGQNEV